MDIDIKERLHILTLAIKRDKDIPRVRAKAKLLARTAGFNRLAIIQTATAGSEVARLLLNKYKGGRVVMSLVNARKAHFGVGIELLFESAAEGAAPPSNVVCQLPLEALGSGLSSGLSRVLDFFEISGGCNDFPIKLMCLKFGSQVSWETLEEKQIALRRDIFADTEESYMENLRAKHDEVLRLLREKSEQNVKLDRANTELLELSQNLEALAQERTIAEMSLAIADQVRNPAVAIGGLSKILLRIECITDEDRPKILAITKQAAKLEKIVAEFDNLAERQSKLFIDDDLRLIVEETASLWKSHREFPEIGLKVTALKDPITIKANRHTLKIAIQHLFRNAAAASVSGDEIAVRVTREEGRPLLIISDKGSGMTPSIQEKLFKEPFTSRQQGAGLGLILARQIINEHQGSIELESEPGAGTVVFVSFPIRWQENSIRKG